MRYFKLSQTPDDQAWFIDLPPEQFDDFATIWRFTSGTQIEVNSSILVEIEQGIEVDFNITAHGIIVLTPRAKDVFAESCGDEVQFLPATSRDGRRLFILNPLRIVDCIDHDRSVIQYCTTRGRAFRHKFGKPEMITSLVLTSAIQNCKIFRVKDWEVTVVASEQVCEAIRDQNLSGVQFVAVSR